VLEVQTYGEALHLLVDAAGDRLEQIRTALDRQGLSYHGLRPAHARMEEAFISIIRQQEESYT
jgi:hypothetical protein